MKKKRANILKAPHTFKGNILHELMKGLTYGEEEREKQQQQNKYFITNLEHSVCQFPPPPVLAIPNHLRPVD